MALPINMTNRRQFLGRSALGAGSLLVAPLLLDSCTDHLIPPDKPINPVHVPSATVDISTYWYDQAKSVLITGLGPQPAAGNFLGSLVETLWPDGQPSVWDQLRVQIETLVGQKIKEDVYTNAIKALDDLRNYIALYLNSLKYGTPGQINDNWEAATDQFVDSQLFLMVPGYELLLMPFFTQFATMYLSLLRDGVAFGQSWVRSDGLHQQDTTTLQAYIHGAVTHVTDWYNDGRYTVSSTAGTGGGYSSDHYTYYCEPFRSVNKYDRQMTLLVLDFKTIWPYFDVTQYPTGVNVVLTREIYSDPFGPGSSLVLPTSPPTQFPTQLSVWAWDLINSMQLTYPSGSGPGGVTTTPQMGNLNGGTNYAPGGAVLTLSSDNPITQFRVVSQIDPFNYAGPYVTAMQFAFYDGTTTNLLGGHALPSDYKTKTHVDGSLYYEDSGWVGYGSFEALSSIFISGENKNYAAEYVTGLVLGFTYRHPPK